MITNMLWIIGVLIGGVLLGIVPSTLTLFKRLRDKVFLEKEEITISKWWSDYKNFFWKPQLVGYVWMLVGYIIYLDYKIVLAGSGVLYTLLLILLSAIFIIYISSTFLLISIYVHYDFKVFNQVRLSILLSLIYPYYSVLFLAVLFVGLFSLNYFPVLFYLLGFSLFSLISTIIAFSFFSKAEKNSLIVVK